MRNKEDFKRFGIKRKDLKLELLKKGFILNKQGMLLTLENTFVSNVILIPFRERVINNHISDSKRIIEFICILEGNLIDKDISCHVELIESELLKILNVEIGLEFKVSKNKKICNDFLHLAKNLDIISKEVLEYSQIGWIKEKKSYAFMDGSKLITSDKKFIHKEYVISKLLLEKKYGINKNNISEKEAFKFSQKMLELAPREITLPLLMFSLASTMNSLLTSVGIEVRFMLWIYGQTGTRKTTISKLFFNFISRNSETVEASFKDTIASIQFKMSQMKDSVIFIDDYHPPSSKNERIELDEKVSFITRSTSDTSNKGRMNKNMTQQVEFKNEGNVAVTAEDIIKGRSAIARTYPVLLKPDSIDLKRLSYIQDNIDNYSTFISYFIEWVSLDTINIIKAIQQYFNELRVGLSKISVHGRVIEQVIQIHIISELYLFYGLQNQYITQDKADEMRCETKTLLVNHIRNMNRLLVQEKPSYLYLKAIEELVLSNQCKIAPKGKIDKSTNIIGWEDDEKIYLLPGIALNNVVRYWRNQNVEFSTSMKLLHQELHDNDLIKVGKDSKTIDYTVKSNVLNNSNDRKRTLTIYKQKLKIFMKDENKEDDLILDMFDNIPTIEKYMAKHCSFNIYSNPIKEKSKSKKIKVEMRSETRSIFDEIYGKKKIRHKNSDKIIKKDGE